MGYYTIQYNKQGEPYIIEKNFGHDPRSGESSSHWTWHIAPRGVQHLKRGPFGKPRPMPRYINDDELEDLKSYNMLYRQDGALINGGRVSRPQSEPAPERRQPQLAQRAATPARKPRGPIIIPHVEDASYPRARPAQRPPARPAAAPKPKRGFLSWLKSLFGQD